MLVRVSGPFHPVPSQSVSDDELSCRTVTRSRCDTWPGSYEAVPNSASGKFIVASGRLASLHHILGTGLKNGRKLVRRRRKWISLVIPLSPAPGKSSRPNEPNTSYRRSKREKSTGVSIRNRQRSFILRKPASRVPRRRFEIDTFRNHDNTNKDVRTNALESSA